MDKRVLVLGGAGLSLISMAAGAIGGYQYAKKKLWNEFSERLEAEVEDTKRFYRTLHKKGAFSTPEDAVRELIPQELKGDTFDNTSVSDETLERIVEGLKYKPSDKPAHVDYNHISAIKGEDQPVVKANIFEQVRHDLPLSEDFDEEEARELEVPYIIPANVFMHGEVGFPNLTLTFFTKDRVLVDDADNLIGTATEYGDDIDKLIGMDNLKFGYLSEDPNVVYIRNNQTGYDYEILRSEGSYAEVVAGLGSAD